MFRCQKQDLNLVTVNPAVENTLSAGVDVIGMVRYLLATHKTRGNLCWFSFHHSKGCSSLSIGLSFKYDSTSLSTGSASSESQSPSVVVFSLV